MKKYRAVFRIRFVSGLQYRAAALAGLATQFAWGFLSLLAFSAFYKTDPSSFPMSFPQTVTYIWLQQAFLALFMTWFPEAEILEAITGGGVAYEMARPVDLYSRWFCQSVANRLAKAVLRCFPILLVAFLIPGPFRMSLPPNAGQFLLFLVSASLSLCVVVAVNMLVYIMTFYTLSPQGVRLIVAALADFLAGGIIPIPFFPEPFRKVAELLPFAAMENMPLRLYNAHISGLEAVKGLVLQVFWLTVLVLVGRLAMKRALTRVVVQGG
jgi:ABC-2 type transport system permease protein